MRRSSAKTTEARCADFWRQLETDREFSDCYDTLMTSLEVAGASRPLASIMLTSARPEEGKTTVTLALALAMIRAGKNVLIVDTDLRRPRIHRLLGLENSRGLADIVTGSAGVPDVVRTVGVGDDARGESRTLSAITSGMASPASYHALGSPKLREVIEYVTKLYDVVLLDSPPALAVSDPMLLAPIVDGVVLVLSTGAITQKEVASAKKRLEESGARIVGLVLNRFDEKAHGPGVHPYHSYYSREAE